MKLGDQFGMAMKRGVPYSTTNTVIEFEDNRRIAWHTCSPSFIGKILGGPIWRYELEPVDGGTRVRESWDISQTQAASKPLLRSGPRPQGHAQVDGEDPREHREAARAS